MEPPAYQGFGAVQTEKFKVFKAMRPLAADDVVRGQFAGYREEAGVAAGSDVETFCALRLFIDSWRWAGVPWYLRSRKCLAEGVAEVVVELNPPPQPLFTDAVSTEEKANYLRFRLSPSPVIAIAARVKQAGEEFVGDQRELTLLNAQPGEEQPYERLLGDALAGDGALFTREDGVGRLGSRRSGPESAPSGASVSSRKLGTRGSGQAHRPARRLAQPGVRPRADMTPPVGSAGTAWDISA